MILRLKIDGCHYRAWYHAVNQIGSPMTTTRHARLIILGSGPAGYSAAVYAARANRAPLLISGVEQGGQLMTTTDVDNWPGDVEGLQGPALMERMRRRSEEHTSELQSPCNLVCRLLLEKKKSKTSSSSRCCRPP